MATPRAPLVRSERDLQRLVDAIIDLQARVTAAEGASTPTFDLAAAIHAATGKTTPADNDEIPGADSADSWALKKFTWANIKAALATWVASVTVAFTNKTFDANGAGNSISNLEVADFAANVADTDGTLTANSDARFATQKAVKTYVDAAGGGVTQLATWTFSGGVASVPFTGLSQGYSALYITWSGVSFNTNGNELRFRVSVDNGANYLSGATDYYNGTGAATGLVMGASASSSSTTSGFIILFGYSSSGVLKSGSWAALMFVSGTSQSGTFMVNTASAINAIQFTGDAGNNFDAGTITVYGVK